MRTWKPDTCECHIEEVYEGNTIVGGGQVLNKCEAHTEVPDDELYGVLYSNPDGENKRKNLVYKHIIETQEGILSERVMNKSGDETLELKPGIEFGWEWQRTGKNRVMKLKLSDKRTQKTDNNLLGASQEMTLLDVEEKIRQELLDLFGNSVIF